MTTPPIPNTQSVVAVGLTIFALVALVTGHDTVAGTVATGLIGWLVPSPLNHPIQSGDKPEAER